MDDINTPQLTKLQMYCSALYNIMDKDAVAVTLSDSTEVRVWRGLITETAASVGAGEGVYSRVIDRLTILGCIAVLDRGRRNNPSTVALHFPPTAEVWARKNLDSDLTNRPSPAMMQAELRDIRGQLGGLNVIKALSNLDQRLTEVEIKLAKLEEQE